MLNDLRAFFQKAYNQSQEIKRTLTGMTAEELCDLSLEFEDGEKLLADLEKEMRKVRELMEKIICHHATTGDVSIYRTDHGTFTPNVKMIFDLPHRSKDPEGFATLLSYLKIPDHELISLDWKAVQERINTAVAEGRPLPPGIDPTKATYPQFRVSKRRRAMKRGGEKSDE